MARTSRVLNAGPPRREPSSPLEWERLLRQAVALAQRNKDRRLAMLQNALPQGQARAVLKRLGIICEADLTREFPDLQT